MHTSLQCVTHSDEVMGEEPREYWDHYVKQCGGATAAAERLKTPYSTIAGICNGSRGIGRDLAQRFAESDPMLDPSKLLWVRAIRRREERAA